MGKAGKAALAAARSRLAMYRQLATTPGRLRLAIGLLTVGAIVFGVVAIESAGTRRDAVRRVAGTEPLLVSAVDLSASLSDAHAIAAASFLVGGPEPAISRRRYDRELQKAGSGVARLAGEIGPSSSGTPAVQLIVRKLPVYAGFVDSARANHRQGFPVGSAYLRRASETMRFEMQRSARDLYEAQATNLTASYRAGVSTWTVVSVLLAAGLLLAALTATQVYLARATRRIVNVPLALATVALLGLTGWMMVAFAGQHSALASAQREGTDPVELLTATRILASRVQALESIALSARGGGGGEERLDDVDRGFQVVVKPIGSDRDGEARGSGGLLDEAAAAVPSSAPIDAIYAAYRRYLAAHDRVVEQEQAGDFPRAIAYAVSSATTTSAADASAGRNCVPAKPTASTEDAASAMNCLLVREIGAARARFARSAARAESRLGGLKLGIPALTLACALLALFGVRQRLEEYR
jgi:hypothetical protein